MMGVMFFAGGVNFGFVANKPANWKETKENALEAFYMILHVNFNYGHVLFQTQIEKENLSEVLLMVNNICNSLNFEQTKINLTKQHDMYNKESINLIINEID